MGFQIWFHDALWLHGMFCGSAGLSTRTGPPTTHLKGQVFPQPAAHNSSRAQTYFFHALWHILLKIKLFLDAEAVVCSERFVTLTLTRRKKELIEFESKGKQVLRESFCSAALHTVDSCKKLIG